MTDAFKKRTEQDDAFYLIKLFAKASWKALNRLHIWYLNNMWKGGLKRQFIESQH